MAIIVCPDCGTQFSDTAPACPHCGRPNFTQARPQQQPGPGAPYGQPGGPAYGGPPPQGQEYPPQGASYGQGQPGAGDPYAQPGGPYAPQNTAYARRPPPRPDNYLWQSIAVTLCCCLPGGIVSLVYSSKVNSRYDQGDFRGAQEASDNAEKWMYISIVVGLVAAVGRVLVALSTR